MCVSVCVFLKFDSTVVTQPNPVQMIGEFQQAIVPGLIGIFRLIEVHNFAIFSMQSTDNGALDNEKSCHGILCFGGQSSLAMN